MGNYGKVFIACSVILTKFASKYHHKYSKLNSAKINVQTTFNACATWFSFFSLSLTSKFAKLGNLQTISSSLVKKIS